MPPFKQTFPVQPETSIASYSYTDIAEGTGVVVFYPMNENTGGTDDYLLTSNIMYSNDVFSFVTTAATSATKILDLDFDVSFNFPQRIKGDVIVSIPIFCQRGPSYTHSTYAVIQVRHWDGTTETDLGSGQTESVVGAAGASTYVDAVKTVKINIGTLKHFKKGETLRITVEIWGQTANAGEARNHGFGHDPKDRAETTVFPIAGTTKTEVHVPFVLDL